jgi:hypothetical protein
MVGTSPTLTSQCAFQDSLEALADATSVLGRRQNGATGVTSDAAVFRLLAEEAMSSASEAACKGERQALEELACTFAQASLLSDRVFGSSFTQRPRPVDQAPGRPSSRSSPTVCNDARSRRVTRHIAQRSLAATALGVEDARTVQQRHITFLEYTLENTPIKARWACPKCTTPMYLACIAPDESGVDRGSFECPRCQHVETTVVKFK